MNGGSGIPRFVRYGYFVMLAASLPLLNPPLPLNTALLDFVNLPFVFGLGIWLLYRRRLAVRLVWPAIIILLGSLIGMYNTAALATNAVTLLQEAYLFVFLLTVFNIVEDEKDLRVLATAWMLAAMVEGAAAIVELRGSMVARSQGTFPNPNLAASYLGMSLFLVCQTGPRVRWPWRLLFLVPVIGGTLATKSLSALLACTVGGLVIGAVAWTRGSGVLRRRVAVLGVALLVAALMMIPAVLQMEHFLDRLPRSGAERTVVWSAAVRSFLGNPLGIGVGPAGFREVGYVQGGQFGVGRRISLHDDYLAFLVERGVVGFAGLVLLLVALAAAVIRAARAAASDDQVMRVAGLAAMFAFTLVDSTTHEVTHYRHVWLVWALILALERTLRNSGDEVSSAPVAEQPG